MRIGCIISMYDEIDQVNYNIKSLKNENCPIIVIQSNPTHNYEILDESKVDFYKLLPDVAGSKENYIEIGKRAAGYAEGKISDIAAKALTRNFSHAFKAATNFDVDWWLVVLGDVKIHNLIGIKKIIKKMQELEKHVGVTRGVGLKYPDETGTKYTRIQREDTTDFLPQTFIVDHDYVKKGFFHNLTFVNPSTEICLGNGTLEFCEKNSLEFWDVVYSICDYPAPKWIEGFEYIGRVILPGFLLGPMNWYRKIRMKIFWK